MKRVFKNKTNESETIIVATSLGPRGLFAPSARKAKLIMFEEIADCAPVAIWRSDATMACDWANKAWLEFTGRSFEQELGFGWTDILHPEDRIACLATYEQASTKGHPFSLRCRMRRADRAFRWVLHQMRPFKNDDGQIKHFLERAPMSIKW